MLERMCGKGNTPLLLVGVQSCVVSLEIRTFISQKIGNKLSQDPAILLLGINPKDTQSYYKDMLSTTFIAALFVIPRTWKQSRCPSTEKWLKKDNWVPLSGKIITSWNLQTNGWIKKEHIERDSQDPERPRKRNIICTHS